MNELELLKEAVKIMLTAIWLGGEPNDRYMYAQNKDIKISEELYQILKKAEGLTNDK